MTASLRARCSIIHPKLSDASTTADPLTGEFGLSSLLAQGTHYFVMNDGIKIEYRWAVGITAYQCFFGKLPFRGEKDDRALKRMICECYYKLETHTHKPSTELTSFLTELMKKKVNSEWLLALGKRNHPSPTDKKLNQKRDFFTPQGACARNHSRSM